MKQRAAAGEAGLGAVTAAQQRAGLSKRVRPNDALRQFGMRNGVRRVGVVSDVPWIAKTMGLIVPLLHTRCAFSPMRKQMRLANGWSRPSDAALGAMS
jgi:hypothetical protein